MHETVFYLATAWMAGLLSISVILVVREASALVRVLPQYIVQGPGLYVATISRKNLPIRVRLLREFLINGYAQAPGLPSDFWQSVPGVPAPSAPPPPRLLEPGEVLDSPTTEPLRVVVRPGESMWEFAERVYGDGREYKRIWLANNFLLQNPDNPDLIHPGQELLIPPLPASR